VADLVASRASTEHHDWGRLDPALLGERVEVVEIEKQPSSNFVERQPLFRNETPKPPLC
jgi:hypothetical protein